MLKEARGLLSELIPVFLVVIVIFAIVSAFVFGVYLLVEEVIIGDGPLFYVVCGDDVYESAHVRFYEGGVTTVETDYIIKSYPTSLCTWERVAGE